MGALRAVKQSSPLEQPFRSVARDYFATGWNPLPLPPKRKEKVPVGYTGWKATKRVNQRAIDNWLSSQNPKSNVAQQPTLDYIGIDVDLYKPNAPEQWEAIVAEMGELPETWTSSAKADGSGIRHYRLPEEFQNLAWPGTVGEVIQFCHVGHRYPVLPPSVHPDGGNYLWYPPGHSPDGEVEFKDFPAFADLPELDEEWIEYFTQGRFARILPEKNLGPKSKATKAVSEWIASQSEPACAKMLRVYEEVLEAFDATAAHDTMRDGFYRLSCLAAEDHKGLAEVAELLHEAFLLEIRREGRAGTVRGAREAEEEWLRARDSGVKKVMARQECGDFYGYECTCGGLDPEGNPKPSFNVGNYDLVTAMDQCYRAVAATQLTDWKGAYNRGGQIVHSTAHGISEAKLHTMRSAVARVSEWYAPGGDGPPMKKNPPDALLNSMLVDPELNTLPGLRYDTRSPFWALVDGKPILVHENGYHAGSQVLLDMDPELALAVANVDGDDFTFGLKQIEYMIHKVPFEGAADKTNVYAALLLPYVRELINGPTPLHLIHAPSPGSGKSLLANTISKVVCGMAMEDRFSVTLPNGRNADEEIRKLTTTVLRQSPRVVIWDNVVGEVRSKEIAQTLTEPIYNARLLSTNDSLRLANSCLWLMTGNQFKAIEDIRRRIVPIKLRAVKPKNPFDMDDFLEKNRKYIVWALLSMVQRWVDLGMPLARDRALASYERYVEVIGGILAANGIEGFLGNLAEFNEQTTGDSGEYTELIEEWSGVSSNLELGAWYRVGDILAALPSASEWVDSSKPGANGAFGAILTSMKDRPIGEHGEYLLQFKRPGNVAHYMLTLRAKAKVVRRGGRRLKVRGHS